MHSGELGLQMAMTCWESMQLGVEMGGAGMSWRSHPVIKLAPPMAIGT